MTKLRTKGKNKKQTGKHDMQKNHYKVKKKKKKRKKE